MKTELPVNSGQVVFDLGKVVVLAAIKLNGRGCGVVWKEPCALDVGDVLQAGRKNLEIRVVNTWANCQIGDALLQEDQRIFWVTWSPYKPADPLMPSGLPGLALLRNANP